MTNPSSLPPKTSSVSQLNGAGIDNSEKNKGTFNNHSVSQIDAQNQIPRSEPPNCQEV